jgi:hypothetical protein
VVAAYRPEAQSEQVALPASENVPAGQTVVLFAPLDTALVIAPFEVHVAPESPDRNISTPPFSNANILVKSGDTATVRHDLRPALERATQLTPLLTERYI